MMISFDFETELFGPGNRAPRAVCLSWARPGPIAGLSHASSPLIVPDLKCYLGGSELLVGQNVAYDTGVICSNWPGLIPDVFAKYERDQILCTKIREQLIDTALGRFRGSLDANGEWVQRGYSLDDLSHRYRGTRMQKDGWRMFYGEFLDVPLSGWVEHAKKVQHKYGAELQVLRYKNEKELSSDQKQRIRDLVAMIESPPETVLQYPIDDAVATLEVFNAQEQAKQYLADQFRQTRYQFALALTMAYGLRTDPVKVEEFARLAEEDFYDLKKELVGAGLVRPDKVAKKTGKVTPGAADTAKARELMLAACIAEGIDPLMTKGSDTSPPQISLGQEACARVDDPLIKMYSEFQIARKVLSNDVEMLKDALNICHPNYDMAATGRTTCASPNIQALRKKAGIRDCFVPDQGNVFIQCDYPSLELFTRAQWCLTVLGTSELGATLNAGKDPHLQVAAAMLGITYDDALKRKGEPEIKKARNQAKAINFGLPGGLGWKRLIDYAHNTFKVELSEEEAKTYGKDWKRAQPEVNAFFALAADLCNNDEGRGGETSPFTGQITSGKKYSELCNERFQRLGADIAKLAMWLVAKDCYLGEMKGWHPVAFIHDELLLEGPELDAPRAAARLAYLMMEAANVYLKDVPMKIEGPMKLEPLIMTYWAKDAEPCYSEEGKLIPWTPKNKAI